MKRIIAVLILTIITLSFSGCKGNDASLTNGKWIVAMDGMSITRQFNDDGTTSEWINKTIRSDGIYKIVGSEISVTMTSMTNEETGVSMDLPVEINWQWSYSITGKKLTLIDLGLGDNEKVVYTKE